MSVSLSSRIQAWAAAIYRGVLRTLDASIVKLPTRPDTSSVLLLRLDNIGDFVLWFDAAQALAQHYHQQSKQVILLASSSWAELARSTGVFDHVIAVDRRHFLRQPLYRMRLSWSVRRLQCALALNAPYSRAYDADVLLRASGAQERIGFVSDGMNLLPSESKRSDHWYTRLLPQSTSSSELLHNAEFVRAVANPSYRAGMSDLRFFAAQQTAPSCMSELQPGEDFYVLFPSASFSGKGWPAASFAHAAEFLHANTQLRGVLCGAPEDSDIAAQVMRASSAPLLDWTGRTTLPELAVVLTRARVLLTNDTSAVHIAAAVGCASVCTLGGGHFGRFMPYTLENTDDRPMPLVVAHPLPCYHCNWQCVFPTAPGEAFPCLSKITVASVETALRQALSLK